MNHPQHSRGSPWWETELSSIRREQSAYLRRRLPAFGSDHEDLLNDTLFALTKHIRDHVSSLPDSWFAASEPTEDADRQRLHKLARTILRRRIADFFRTRVRVKASYAPADYGHSVLDPKASSPDRQILLSQMLQLTLVLLDELPQKDRDLVALISDDARFRDALSSSERKRLHRIRLKLKKRVARQLGAEAADLLRISS